MHVVKRQRKKKSDIVEIQVNETRYSLHYDQDKGLVSYLNEIVYIPRGSRCTFLLN